MKLSKLLLIIFIATFKLSSSQTDTLHGFIKPDTLKIGHLDQNAEYIGGQDSLLNFIKTNLKYEWGLCSWPSFLDAKFIIDENGEYSSLTAFRPGDAALALEIIRVFKLMPKWKPAIQNSKPVKSEQSLYLIFKR